MCNCLVVHLSSLVFESNWGIKFKNLFFQLPFETVLLFIFFLWKVLKIYVEFFKICQLRFIFLFFRWTEILYILIVILAPTRSTDQFRFFNFGFFDIVLLLVVRLLNCNRTSFSNPILLNLHLIFFFHNFFILINFLLNLYLFFINRFLLSLILKSSC